MPTRPLAAGTSEAPAVVVAPEPADAATFPKHQPGRVRDRLPPAAATADGYRSPVSAFSLNAIGCRSVPADARCAESCPSSLRRFIPGGEPGSSVAKHVRWGCGVRLIVMAPSRRTSAPSARAAHLRLTKSLTRPRHPPHWNDEAKRLEQALTTAAEQGSVGRVTRRRSAVVRDACLGAIHVEWCGDRYLSLGRIGCEESNTTDSSNPA